MQISTSGMNIGRILIRSILSRHSPGIKNRIRHSAGKIGCNRFLRFMLSGRYSYARQQTEDACFPQIYLVTVQTAHRRESKLQLSRLIREIKIRNFVVCVGLSEEVGYPARESQ